MYTAFAVLGTILLWGCALRAGYYGDDINGAAVERTIDANLAPLIRSYDPSLKIEPAKCAAHLDLSHGKTATCSMSVNGVALPLVVKYQGPAPQGYVVNLPGSFFERRTLERGVTLAVALGQVSAINCPMAPVAILAAGTVLVCKAQHAGGVVPIRVRIGQNGHVDFGPTGKVAETPLEHAINVAVRKHNSGKPTQMQGSLLAQFIDISLRAEMSHRAVAIGPTVCPSMLDLTGARRGACAISIAGRYARVAVWIDRSNNGTLHWLQIDALVELSHLSNLVTGQLNASLQQNGYTSVASVNCGSGTIVVPAPGVIICSLQLDGRPDISNGVLQEVRVDVLDGAGRVKIKVLASNEHPK